MKARVYEDPITRLKLEGIATVLELTTEFDGDGYARVWCTIEGDEQAVYRTIHRNDVIESTRTKGGAR